MNPDPKRGKLQMYQLGLNFRENYKMFLSQYYSPNELLVLSSYADRTLMSAQLVLAGLFPPVEKQIWNENLLWQPIPVKYLPRDLDNIIAQKRKCPVYDKAYEEVCQSDEMKRINEENKSLYEYLTEQTGEKIDSIGKVETLYNTLEIEIYHNLLLPKWVANISMDHLHTLAAKNLATFSNSTLMKRLKGGPFLKTIISHMLQKSEDNVKVNLDFVLYSGHDLTIVTVLRTLGFEKLLKPDYGASLIFELHEFKLNYEVKLFYKPNITEIVQLELSFCSSPCLLSDFINNLGTVLPVNWEEECLNNN